MAERGLRRPERGCRTADSGLCLLRHLQSFLILNSDLYRRALELSESKLDLDSAQVLGASVDERDHCPVNFYVRFWPKADTSAGQIHSVS